MIIEFFLIGFITFFASLISFFSGFGLATILMPFIAIFFPLPLAIALTAVVHLFHDSLKTAIFWPAINWKSAINFGGPAVIFSIFGALLLKHLSQITPIKNFSIFNLEAHISILHISIGLLLLIFATLEILPVKIFKFKNLFLGGVISGFLGGFSGHQGAFRSLFLINTIYDKKSFVGTSAIISVFVDLMRLIIYGLSFWSLFINYNISILLVAIIGAIFANIIGVIFLKKITIKFIHQIVIVLLYLFGVLFIIGII